MVLFEEDLQSILSRSVSIGALLAGILVPSFSILDYIFKQPNFTAFLSIRILVSLCSWIIYAACKVFKFNKPYYLGALLTIIVGGSIAVMCTLDMGPADPYYAGINLPILGFGVLLPMTIAQSLIPAFITWLIYLIPNISNLGPETTSIFISNNFFIASSIVIAVASSRFHLKQRRLQWLTNNRLQVAHQKIESYAKNLEQEVKERTRQALQSEKLAVVGQLAGGIAHDFNNILTVILGTTQILLPSLYEEDPLKQDIDTINKAANKAVGLVKQLLAFSKNQVIQPKIININDVIQKSKKMLSRIIGEDIDLQVQCGIKLKPVKADPVQIEQIIFNLAVNARDAMKNGGTLRIETSNVTIDSINRTFLNRTLKPGTYVMISTADNGIGMTEDVKEKIFEPFFTTKDTQGTGLGLSTVYGIVKQSSGEILCKSRPGQGTTFTILLPACTGSAELKKPADKDLYNFARGTGTILLVEDQEEVRILTARILKKFGYTVLEAEKPYKALALADRFHGTIDLLLTDVVMPEMNGYTLTNKIVSKYPHIKVIFTSGYTNHPILSETHKPLSASFIQKPFTMEILADKIRSVLHN